MTHPTTTPITEATMPHHHDPETSAAARAAAILPFPATGAPGGVPRTTGPDPVRVALARLEAFVEDEGPDLVRVFSLLDLAGAQADVAALHALLEDEREAGATLATAAALLDRIVENLAETPIHAEVQRPTRSDEEACVRHLDATVRWLGARAEEVLRLLRRPLA